MSNAILLSLDVLRFSSKKRRGVSPKRVEELRQLVENSEEIMPIRVCALEDGTYVVRDGRHRIQAHIAAGIDNIFAFVENIEKRFKKIWGFFSLTSLRAGFFT